MDPQIGVPIEMNLFPGQPRSSCVRPRGKPKKSA